MENEPNRRILIVDDNPGIHEDFRKILSPAQRDESSLMSSESALFGDEPAAAVPRANVEFELSDAAQGLDGVKLASEARASKRPFAVAFVDMRMPPGLDGVETIERLWKVDPEVQVVICTAFADYTWPQMIERLGRTDRLLILKKPYDAVEVCQLATALTEKWNSNRREREQLAATMRAEQEARAYAASVETVNRALQASWARSEADAAARSEFTLNLANEVLAPVARLLQLSLAPSRAAGSAGAAGFDAEPIVDAATSLAQALKTVLDLTEADAGRLSLQASACSPWEIAAGVHRRGSAAAAGLPVSVELVRASDLPETIFTDAARVAQVLDELVANALRHTRHGSVRIEVGQRSDLPGESGQVQFRVVDTGEGIAPEDRARLFEPFGLSRSASEGNSLGLALAKRIALRLGGDLNLDSAPGQGARFTLQLPLGVSAARS